MILVTVVGEGQTEETFIRDVLKAPLAAVGIYLTPRLIRTSRTGRGGGLSGGRVTRFLRNTLLEHQDAFVTTFFDLYGLSDDFPGVAEGRLIGDPIERAETIERALRARVVAEADCGEERFFPHIQPYEFEALLFTDIGTLTAIEPGWATLAPELEAVREAAGSPEHINDGPETHPSARLIRALKPRYEKVLHGPLVAGGIGLERMRAACRHFGAWLTRLETLVPPVQLR